MDSSSDIGNYSSVKEYSPTYKRPAHRRVKEEEEIQVRKDNVVLSDNPVPVKKSHHKSQNREDRIKRKTPTRKEPREFKPRRGAAFYEDSSTGTVMRIDGEQGVPTTMTVFSDGIDKRPVHHTDLHGAHRRQPITDLKILADRALAERGFLTDFSKKEMQELNRITKAAQPEDSSIHDLRNLLWCSIDNDDSRDLDQLTVSEKLPNGDVKILVAIADVDALVPKGSAIDTHAQHNTTSIYTSDKIYPMLPEKLSTDLTSLNPDEDRLAVVIEYTVDRKGMIRNYDIYRAQVRNHAKLAYNATAAWLEGQVLIPSAVARVPGLEEQLRVQNEVAKKLKERRHENGSLTLETIEPKAKILDGKVLDLEAEESNCAKELIENFMVAANGVVARYLEKQGFPTLMRVVKTPKRWDRIVAIAAEKGTRLPLEPDSKALEKFLTEQRKRDPLHFPDLSLNVVKCLGRGEYIVQNPGSDPMGHFGLAVKDYSHSTAPNRRYPDLITQRMIKAALEGKPCPYSIGELEELALHCTKQEANADKAERQARKSAQALYLSDKIGQTFDAVVTGVNKNGTWIRLLKPPAEGKLVSGEKGVDIGDQIRVRLESVDVERGFIDFSRNSISHHAAYRDKARNHR